MKKFIAILMIFVMLFTLVSCASEEISMYSLMSEMSKLKVVESSNTISVSLDEDSMADTLENIPPEMEALKNTLVSGFEIRYAYKLNKKTSEYEVAIELKNKGESDYKKVTTLIGNATTTYIKVNDLLKFVKLYATWDDPVINRTIDNIIAKVEYLKIDLDNNKNRNYTLNYYNNLLSDTRNAEKQVKLMDEFIETIKEAFKDFSFEVITKKDNGYEMQLKPEDIKLIYFRFIKYIVNNIDLIASKLTDKVNSLDDEQMEILSEGFGYKVEKSDMVSGIEEFKEEVKETTPEEIEEMENDQSFDEALKSYEGSQVKYYVGKTSEGCYESTLQLLIKYEDEFEADISITSETKAINDFSLVVPLNTTTIEELNGIIYSTVPVKARKVKVKLNKKEADIDYNNGKKENSEMQNIIKDGYTYLPLRKVGETFGEEVYWDNAKKEAYVVANGRKIVMKGLIYQGRTYVKVRDFEKLGYEIDWDAENREVLIESNSKYPVLDSLSYIK